LFARSPTGKNFIAWFVLAAGIYKIAGESHSFEDPQWRGGPGGEAKARRGEREKKKKKKKKKRNWRKKKKKKK